MIIQKSWRQFTSKLRQSTEWAALYHPMKSPAVLQLTPAHTPEDFWASYSNPDVAPDPGPHQAAALHAASPEAAET